jgi:DedD protein
MGLFSYFKRQGRHRPRHRRLRRRLSPWHERAPGPAIGAVVLLGIGVIAFPLLFESQPRPIPVDIAIEGARGAPTLTMPPPRPASAAAVKPSPCHR